MPRVVSSSFCHGTAEQSDSYFSPAIRDNDGLSVRDWPDNMNNDAKFRRR